MRKGISVVVIAFFVALSLLTATALAASEVEPNDEFGDATQIPLNEAVSATIYPAGDYDWFKVSVTETGILNISVVSVPAGMRAEIQLYDANNWYITGVTASSAGEPVSLRRDVTPADYFIRIRDYAGGSYTSPYVLIANFEEISDAYEPNGKFSQAAEIPIDAKIQAYIFPAGDYDWFKVNITSAGVLNISVTNVPTYMRPCIGLYNANKGYITGVTGATGKNTTLTRDVRKGIYYIRINDCNGRSYVSPYTLTVSLLEVADAYEPNHDIAHAAEIPLGSYNAYIFPSGDKDYFKVNVTEDSRLKVSVTNVPTYMRPRIELYDANRGYITGITGSTGSNTTLTRDVFAGVYFVKIEDNNGKSHIDPYTLTISVTPVPDAYEPNYDLAHATLLTSTGSYNAYIFPSGDKDYFKFYVASAGTLTISVSDIPSPYMKMRIELYNKNLDLIAYATAPSAGSPVSLSRSVSEGMHYLLIYDNAGKSATDSYTLTLSGVTITTPPALPSPVTSEKEPNNVFGDANVISLGKTITGSFYPKYDYDWFRVKVEKAGVLNISVTKVPAGIDAHINLYDENGNWLGGKTGSVGSPVYLRRDVTPGWYFIRLDDYYDQSTDNYKFIVTLTEADDENEPNDEFSEAVEIALDEEVKGFFFPKYDSDWFKVNISTPGVLNISVTEVPTYCYAHINLYDENGHYLAGKSGSVGTPVSLLRDVTPGLYYIKIDDYYDRSEEPYTMVVTLKPVDDENEPNEEFSEAVEVALDEEIEGFFFPEYDNDWFKVNVTTAGILRIKVSEVPTYCEAHINLYDADANWLAGITSGESSPVTLTYDALPGIYYFKIDDYYDRSEEPYKFKVTLEEAPDAYEPNNDFAHATPITDAELNAYIFKSGDYDWFKAYVSSTGTISAEITNVPSPYMKMRIEIYDKNNRWLTGATAPLEGEPVSVSYDVTTAGTYYFRIYDTAGKRSTSPYTVQFSGIDINESIPPVIYDVQPAENDIVTDSTPEISAYYYDIGSGVDTSAVRIYVDGADVSAEAVVLQTKVSYVPATPLSDGTHTVKVIVADRKGNIATKTWSFEVTTKPSVFLSLEGTEFSPGDTMNLTIRIVNPTATTKNYNLLWYINLKRWKPVAIVPVTLTPGFDRTYFVPYTVGNWGSSAFNGMWGVALQDPKTKKLVSTDIVSWTYTPSAKSSQRAESEVAAEIASTIQEAVENALNA
ncbi:MAG: Ig-like domain-containing protein [Candidatus Methanospirare jalkutatii]|nr:Ig-like domain-containing protein [Candidatus Methanospirare jalkutatii]